MAVDSGPSATSMGRPMTSDMMRTKDLVRVMPPPREIRFAEYGSDALGLFDVGPESVGQSLERGPDQMRAGRAAEGHGHGKDDAAHAHIQLGHVHRRRAKHSHDAVGADGGGGRERVHAVEG